MSPTTKKTTAKKLTAKKATKKASKKATKKAPAATAGLPPVAGKQVTIRMYNIGFGDSFLLTIPAADRPRKILVDCGVHLSGQIPGVPVSRIVQQIVADVTEADGTPRIDLVIATHRHRDHVVGFENELWETVEVAEVWMPWTEDPKDELAKKIREKQSKIGKHLDAALTRLLLDKGLSASKTKETQSLKEFVSNSLTNAEAMRTLHEGFARGSKAPRRFLPYKQRDRNTLEPALLPGVTAHVMGPSHDEEIIRDMDPPKGQSYLRLAEAAPGDGEPFLPFHKDWEVSPKQFDPGQQILKASELGRINNIGDGTEFGVAVALEQAVNGTSLMLMLQIGKAYLLFPGDAQWGTWKAALDDPEWRALLEKTNFYKVGHHGSHNATPKMFVEEVLGKKFLAMASLRPISTFKFIPKAELLTALRKTGKVVRSDQADVPDPQGITRAALYVETKIPI
ncbi:MAG: hypothetical protein HYR56_31740 [Acidobacteria bacterium]|nr:hypothetical protein [Acidobacteriota bacterium]MBI3427530.1 hypothetical protein [Acidobacteriota bacterium]